MTNFDYAALAASQTDHPVVLPVTVEALREMGAEAAIEFLDEREAVLKSMEDEPLANCWEPDIWRRIDLKVAQKRLENPGMVLEIFVTGGMRPGKSYSCARRMVAHFVHTKKAVVFALAETVGTSRMVQQQPIERFLPEGISPQSGKKKTTKHERLKFSGGHFTNEQFAASALVKDVDGETIRGGGDFVFRFYSQEIGTFQGFELTAAWSDELVPLPHVKAIRERMATRANETRNPVHLARIERIVAKLQTGETASPAELAVIYHGCHLVSFTPYLGWSETVNYFLRGAEKLEMEISPDLVNKAGVQDPRVPRFAQPIDSTQLVAYVFTSDNKMKPAYQALSAQLSNSQEAEVRIKLHGDVTQDWSTLFSAFSSKHIVTWAQIPRQGTIYEVVDPGSAKPWVVSWNLCDVAGRIWIIQEFPCPSIPVEGSLPGPWAVPSEKDKINGDKGPAQRLRLAWSRKHYLRMIWQMRQRIVEKFKSTGEPFAGKIVQRELEWKDLPDWKLSGEFAMPERSIMDSRFAGAPSESQGVHTTVLEALYDEENAIDFEPASGQRLQEGDGMIISALNDDRLGLPGLLVSSECQNTIFTLKTYSLPEFREATAAKDESCKDFRDLVAYCLLCGPEYIDHSKTSGFSGFAF